MDWDTIERNWDRYKNLAREKWHRIPDTAFESLGGSRDRLIEAIEQAYDVSMDQAQREVSHWSRESAPIAEAQADDLARSRSRARAAAEIRALAEGTSTRIAEGRQRFADLREEAGVRGAVAVDQVRGQVQAHPAATLAIAVGVGMLLGHLMMRRR